MADILTNPSPDALIKAVEDNMAEQFAYFSHSPRSKIVDTTQLLRYLTGIPIAEYNGVMRARFPVDATRETVTSAIQAVIDFFTEQRQSFLWRVGPTTSPTHLAMQLASHGLTYTSDEPGMAMRLDALPEETPTPHGLTISTVCDEATLCDWVGVAGRGYGEGEDILAARLAVHQDLGVGDDLPLRRYVAYYNGEPVAMSAVFLGAGVAGVYEVATAANARRQGIGTAITLAPLRQARALGYHVGVLQASPMGVSVYTRVGFQHVCTFSAYAWDCAR